MKKNWLKQYKKGGSIEPIIVSSKNDPRYIAYQDSLDLYNLSKNIHNLDYPQISRDKYIELTEKNSNLPIYDFDQDQYDKDKKQKKVKNFDDYIYDHRKNKDASQRNLGKHYTDESTEEQLPDGKIKTYHSKFDGKVDKSEYTIFDPISKTSRAYVNNNLIGINNPNIHPSDSIFSGKDKLEKVDEINTSSKSTDWYKNGEKAEFKVKSSNSYVNYYYPTWRNYLYQKPVQDVIYQPFAHIKPKSKKELEQLKKEKIELQELPNLQYLQQESTVGQVNPMEIPKIGNSDYMESNPFLNSLPTSKDFYEVPKYKEGGKVNNTLTGYDKKVDSVYSILKHNTEIALKRKYPNKNYSVEWSSNYRDPATQLNLVKKGNSMADVSLHGLNSAKDFVIKGDNMTPKLRQQLYQDVLWKEAEKLNLHHLDPNGFGAVDLGHIGMVNEDGYSSTGRLLDQEPLLKNTSYYKDLHNYLTSKKKLTSKEQHALNMLNGKRYEEIPWDRYKRIPDSMYTNDKNHELNPFDLQPINKVLAKNVNTKSKDNVDLSNLKKTLKSFIDTSNSSTKETQEVNKIAKTNIKKLKSSKYKQLPIDFLENQSQAFMDVNPVQGVQNNSNDYVPIELDRIPEANFRELPVNTEMQNRQLYNDQQFPHYVTEQIANTQAVQNNVTDELSPNGEKAMNVPSTNFQKYRPKFKEGGKVNKNSPYRRDIIDSLFEKYPGAYSIGTPNQFNIIPATGVDKNSLNKMNRGLEYFSPEDTWYPLNDDINQKRNLPYNGSHRTMVDTTGLSSKQLENAVTLDFLSHGMHKNPAYTKFTNDLDSKLRKQYGNEMVDGNGKVDAYIRGYLSDSPEYEPYKKELEFLPKEYFNTLDSVLKTKPKYKKGGVVNTYQPVSDNTSKKDTEAWRKSQKSNVPKVDLKKKYPKLEAIRQAMDISQYLPEGYQDYMRFMGSTGNASIDPQKVIDLVNPVEAAVNLREGNDYYGDWRNGDGIAQRALDIASLVPGAYKGAKGLKKGAKALKDEVLGASKAVAESSPDVLKMQGVQEDYYPNGTRYQKRKVITDPSVTIYGQPEPLVYFDPKKYAASIYPEPRAKGKNAILKEKEVLEPKRTERLQDTRDREKNEFKEYQKWFKENKPGEVLSPKQNKIIKVKTTGNPHDITFEDFEWGVDESGSKFKIPFENPNKAKFAKENQKASEKLKVANARIKNRFNIISDDRNRLQSEQANAWFNNQSFEPNYHINEKTGEKIYTEYPQIRIYSPEENYDIGDALRNGIANQDYYNKEYQDIINRTDADILNQVLPPVNIKDYSRGEKFLGYDNPEMLKALGVTDRRAPSFENGPFRDFDKGDRALTQADKQMLHHDDFEIDGIRYRKFINHSKTKSGKTRSIPSYLRTEGESKSVGINKKEYENAINKYKQSTDENLFLKPAKMNDLLNESFFIRKNRDGGKITNNWLQNY